MITGNSRGKSVRITSVGWQVILCDLIWQVISYDKWSHERMRFVNVYAVYKLMCTLLCCLCSMYNVSQKNQKIPPEVFWHFFQNGWEFLNQILHTYCPFRSTLDYQFLSGYLQFRWSYAILSAATQFTPHVQNVHHRPKCTPRLHFLIFSPNSWEFLFQILHTYYMFLSTLKYKFLSNYL